MRPARSRLASILAFLAVVPAALAGACGGAVSPTTPPSSPALDAGTAPDDVPPTPVSPSGGGGEADAGRGAGPGSGPEAGATADAGWYRPRCAGQSPRLLDRGDLPLDARLAGMALEPCTAHAYTLVAAQGTLLDLGVVARGKAVLAMAVTYPDATAGEAPIAEVRVNDPEAAGGRGVHGAASLSLAVPRSGELRVTVGAPDVVAGATYDLAVGCVAGCDRETTRFPIVLVHGWTGFAEVGPLEYFYGVPDALRDAGFPVFVAALDPYNSVEVRSEQLAREVDRFLGEGRARKVNLVAHSQGGLDARRVISTLGYGDRVSALVTIATPHRGTPLADLALSALPGLARNTLSFLLDLLGATVTGNESDAEASFRSLGEGYVQNEFNPQNPDDPRVAYVSWTGRTCLFGLSCGDVCDIEIRWSHELLSLLSGPNDGIVPVASARWGDFRGEVPADHFDEVGQLFGVTGPDFDHRAFYLERARDLAAEGH